MPDAAEADVIVPCDGDGVRVVEASDAEIEPVATMDSTRRFARVGRMAPARRSRASPGRASAPALLRSAELTGVAQRAMEMAVEYARDRKQFGRPIGAYQAVSHRCAQMLLEMEARARPPTTAAWTADAEPETLPLAASMAKAYASDAGWRVCSSRSRCMAASASPGSTTCTSS